MGRPGPHPRAVGILRPGRIPGRRVLAEEGGAGRGRRRCGPLAFAPAMPHWSRHALLGEAGRARHGRRFLRSLSRCRALPGCRARPTRAIPGSERVRPAGTPGRARRVRRRFHLLRRPVLAARPHRLGARGGALPAARRSVPHRRVPSLRGRVRRRRGPGRPAYSVPLLSLGGAAGVREHGQLRGADGGRDDARLRVESPARPTS